MADAKPTHFPAKPRGLDHAEDLLTAMLQQNASPDEQSGEAEQRTPQLIGTRALPDSASAEEDYSGYQLVESWLKQQMSGPIFEHSFKSKPDGLLLGQEVETRVKLSEESDITVYVTETVGGKPSNFRQTKSLRKPLRLLTVHSSFEGGEFFYWLTAMYGRSTFLRTSEDADCFEMYQSVLPGGSVDVIHSNTLLDRAKHLFSDPFSAFVMQSPHGEPAKGVSRRKLPSLDYFVTNRSRSDAQALRITTHLAYLMKTHPDLKS